jgi:hypothetical protein
MFSACSRLCNKLVFHVCGKDNKCCQNCCPLSPTAVAPLTTTALAPPAGPPPINITITTNATDNRPLDLASFDRHFDEKRRAAAASEVEQARRESRGYWVEQAEERSNEEERRRVNETERLAQQQQEVP